MLKYSIFTTFSAHTKKAGQQARARRGVWPCIYIYIFVSIKWNLNFPDLFAMCQVKIWIQIWMLLNLYKLMSTLPGVDLIFLNFLEFFLKLSDPGLDVNSNLNFCSCFFNCMAIFHVISDLFFRFNLFFLTCNKYPRDPFFWVKKLAAKDTCWKSVQSRKWPKLLLYNNNNKLSVIEVPKQTALPKSIVFHTICLNTARIKKEFETIIIFKQSIQGNIVYY